MKTDNFSFELPEELIAQHPSERREDSRLMRVVRPSRSDCADISHHHIYELPELLPRDALLVLNNSKVRKARLYGETPHGGKVEFLLIEHRGEGEWKALVSKAKRQKPGKTYRFPGTINARPVEGEIIDSPALDENKKGYRIIRFTPRIDDDYLEYYGHMPLPPYIRREDTEQDEQRYQTVYAEHTGSVAAPTAGLHLSESILEKLKRRGVEVRYLTLHVGLGTFTPIRSERVEEHHMHYEQYSVPVETTRAVTEAKRSGRPVYAVGTTSVRTLESAWDEESSELTEGEGKTNLYIYPGYRFKVVDGLLTNFHTPKSSLLVLVSAFAGKECIDAAYTEAINRRYRFFSYGDAMLIE